MVPAMENEMRNSLLQCANAYGVAKNISISTVGRMAADDWRYFDRLEHDNVSFTARKYDEVMQWFSANWPENAKWPKGVQRPQPERASA